MHHRLVSNSTFRIVCSTDSGSGFSFRREDIIVTNFHVISAHLTYYQPIFAVTEDGHRVECLLLSHSVDDEYDFAILQTKDSLFSGRDFLEPDIHNQLERGTRIIYGGFPHGIADLLIQEAIIAGPSEDKGFYIDGSINGGNSGGPIVDFSTGQLLGIVTKRRFLGGVELSSLSKRVADVVAHCRSISGKGSISLQGINFGAFAQLIGEGLLITDEILRANANSGIGVGYKISYINDRINELDMIN